MTHLFPRRAVLRSAVLAGGVVVTAAACSTDEDPPGGNPPDEDPAGGSARHEVMVRDDSPVTTLTAAEEPTVAASRAVLARASIVVVSTSAAADLDPARAAARALGISLLLPGRGLLAELDRLRARTVLRYGAEDAVGDLGAREVLDGPPASDLPDLEGLPRPADAGSVLVLVADGETVPAALEPLIALTGAVPSPVEHLDPRRDEKTRQALTAAASAPVLAIGEGFGDHLATRVRTAREAPDLPGGGLLPFPERRMVALYGHPSTGALGMLGEQSPAESVKRVQRLVSEYDELSDDVVIPAFEIIATIASGSKGDGSYSIKTDLDVLRPLVDAAEDAGAYVVLDLQPGRTDFLTQAKVYESLLRRPGVGLALDPEWRLKPDQVHLKQIGSVGIEEVNAVGAWLAELVRTHDLPPKVLTLHQFRTSMIRDRERLDTSLDEIQWLVHADGQGGQSAKQDTWRALQHDLPAGVWLGWKNFEDEDSPMLTPEQTMRQVDPAPWFISYQ